MISNFEKTICAIVKEACEGYFLYKNTELITSRLISFNMPIIGMIEPNWENTYEIANDYQHITKLSDNVYAVSCNIQLRDTSGIEDNYFGEYVDVTVSCVENEGKIKFGSVHFSKSVEKILYKKDNGLENKNYYEKSMNYLYDVIFEYDNLSNTFTYDPDKHRKLFEVDTYFVSMDQWFWHMCTECVHPEDTDAMDVFRSNDIIKHIKNDDCVIESELRIKNSKKEYIWIKMVVIFIPAKNKESLERVFVMFKDINDKKLRELDYISKSQKDSLTNLYNREYTEKLITEYLDENDMNYGAYILINIDGFKKINDEFGHITGDEVIESVANALFDSITDEDLIGRITADEFLIFIKKCGDKQSVRERVSKILERSIIRYEEKNKKIEVKCSAGIALTYENGTNLDMLHLIASKELEIAKSIKKDI